jgi:hypothetical protein
MVFMLGTALYTKLELFYIGALVFLNEFDVPFVLFFECW